MITAAIALAIAPFILLTAFFSIEVAAGLLPIADGCTPATSSVSAIVIVPAHNEARIIAQTLRQLKTALTQAMRILVIADNCSDNTAEISRLEGVDVLERNDTNRLGKGYALAFAIEHLQLSPPDVVIVLDADCSVDEASLLRLSSAAAELNRPCQAVNLLRPDRNAAPLVQISGFAFLLKNLVRQRGLQRLSGRVHLTGTGMAIPYWLLSTSQLASGDIVEDLSLGLDLSARGHCPRLCSDALVTSNAARKDETLIQRRRWEGGFLATSFRRAPLLILEAIRTGNVRLGLAALDLSIPPLALLVLLNLAALAFLSAVVVLFGLSWLPLIVDAVFLALAGVMVLAAWLVQGRDFISMAVLARIPFYVAWKLPLYLSLARRGAPRDWLRTLR